MMVASPFAFDAMHLHPYFTLLLTQQNDLGMKMYSIRGQRGGHNHSVAG